MYVCVHCVYTHIYMNTHMPWRGEEGEKERDCYLQYRRDSAYNSIQASKNQKGYSLSSNLSTNLK